MKFFDNVLPGIDMIRLFIYRLNLKKPLFGDRTHSSFDIKKI